MNRLLVLLLIPMSGDAVGPTPVATDNTGGLSGRPAVAVSTPVPREVRQIEAILFGQFDPMQVGLSVWPMAAYLAGDPGEPVPIQEYAMHRWGNAGLAGGWRDTYRLVFDVAVDLEKGDYVIGLDLPNTARLAGSRATAGPAPYYERPGIIPRSNLSAGAARWAANVLAAPPEGDFNADGVVDAFDFATWETGFGSTFDGGALLQWQRGGGIGAAYAPVPEASGSIAAYLLVCIAATFWRD
jgi:hypothetical protein